MSELVHAYRYRENDEGRLVECGFDYMHSKETEKWDAELIAWANEREAEWKRRRV